MRNKLVKGCMQKYWYDRLTVGTCPSPTRDLQGRAKNYTLRYMASFHSLLTRMEQAGYTITRTPGIRGGEWGANYQAVKQSEVGHG